MTKYRFSQVDVFTDRPLLGNPVAVVHAADGIDDARMQSFARWTNLSETVFLLAPTDPRADYRVRIFTPGGELPFAGHPTLGSCHAFLAAGGLPKVAGTVVQECGVGLVELRLSEGRSAFAAPPLRDRAVTPAELEPVLAALGLSGHRVRAARWLDNGPVWLGLLLDHEDTVLGLVPNHEALKTLAKVGVIAARQGAGDTAFEVRGFAASIGVPEDPVTGSLNASLAQWLIREGLAPDAYVAAQGTAMQRVGRVHVERLADTVWVGGHTVTVVDGSVEL
jgi:PhzF family phenazine biosynthesis protein